MVKQLIKGFKDFKKNYFEKEKLFFDRLIKNGQEPKVMIISCSDARVDPSTIFNSRPGELFIVRNVANLVPPYKPDKGLHGVSAAIEFAVLELKVKDIIVLGHAFCGGVSALCRSCKMEQEDNEEKNENKKEFIDDWIKISRKSIMKLNLKDWPGSKQHVAERESIRNSLDNLMTFPWISELVSNNNLKIHGWWFDIENGFLWNVNKKFDEFEKLTFE